MIVECLYPDDTIIQDLFSVECVKPLNLLNSKRCSGILLSILFSLHCFLHAADSLATWESSSVLTDPMSPIFLHRNERDW